MVDDQYSAATNIMTTKLESYKQTKETTNNISQADPGTM